MGDILLSYYEKARLKGGLDAQIKLAMLTLLPSQKAKEALDSDENIKKFEEAFNKI
jgi:hypothetical protein